MCYKFFVVFFVAIVSAQLTEAIHVTKCKSSDAKCIRESTLALMPAFVAGIPEYKVAPMDPLRLDILDASVPGLKLVLQDITVTGLGKCDIQKMERDVSKSKIIAKGLCDVEFKGKYEMDGQLLLFTIQGKGDAHVELRKALIDFEANMVEKSDKQGVKHWDIKSFSHSFDLKDDAKIRLENLFNGNKELAAAADSLFATNGKEVVKAIGTPIMKGLITELVKNVNHFFHRIPLEDLSID